MKARIVSRNKPKKKFKVVVEMELTREDATWLAVIQSNASNAEPHEESETFSLYTILHDLICPEGFAWEDNKKYKAYEKKLTEYFKGVYGNG